MFVNSIRCLSKSFSPETSDGSCFSIITVAPLSASASNCFESFQRYVFALRHDDDLVFAAGHLDFSIQDIRRFLTARRKRSRRRSRDPTVPSPFCRWAGPRTRSRAWTVRYGSSLSPDCIQIFNRPSRADVVVGHAGLHDGLAARGVGVDGVGVVPDGIARVHFR